MLRRFLLLFCTLLAPVCCGHAQSAPDAEAAFRKAVKGRTLFLRGLPADTVVHWSAAPDGTLQQTRPKVHALATLGIESISTQPGRVQLRGRQFIVVRLKGAPTSVPTGEEVQLDVQFDPAKQADVLNSLQQTLFYPGLAGAIADAPSAFRAELLPEWDPGLREAERKQKQVSAKAVAPQDCDPADKFGSNVGIKPARLIHFAAPEFSEEARMHPGKTLVLIGIWVSETGLPTDFWILQPAMDRLNGKALDAVTQYRFQPATCHNQPRAMRLEVEVNFEIQ